MATENHAFSVGVPFTFDPTARGTEASPRISTMGQPWALDRDTAAWLDRSISQLAGIQFVGVTAERLHRLPRTAAVILCSDSISAQTGTCTPYGVGTQDIGASSVRFRKGWFADLDISGTCTGCGGSPPITWTLQTNADILTMQHHLSSGTTARNILTQYSRGTNASIERRGWRCWLNEKAQYYAGVPIVTPEPSFKRSKWRHRYRAPTAPDTFQSLPPTTVQHLERKWWGLEPKRSARRPSFGAKWFAGMWPSVSATL